MLRGWGSTATSVSIATLRTCIVVGIKWSNGPRVDRNVMATPAVTLNDVRQTLKKWDKVG